jgi:aryl-alcohol dehydrogenase-like predicted oxidoreductase
VSAGGGLAATAEATAALAARAPASTFYRPAWDGLTAATIGLGTYLGEADAATDERYAAALRQYVALGGNLIDTASNYRFQRSERAIGTGLKAAIAAGEARRAEVILCTKGGYVPFDGGWPADPEGWIRAAYVDTGLVEPDEIVDGHCMAPGFLRHQIAQSRANLQVARIDLYYLHNPEGQRAALGETTFLERLREAFATLEVAVAQGHIGAYGLATWNGFRARPAEGDYLSLATVLEVARDVSGDRHHLRAIQLPLNLQMLEALGRANQPSGGGLVSMLAAAAEAGVTVIASAPLLQGRVVGRLPETLRAQLGPDLTDAQRALQFARSAPGLTAVLAGMSQKAHVEENLALAGVAPMAVDTFQTLFAG